MTEALSYLYLAIYYHLYVFVFTGGLVIVLGGFLFAPMATFCLCFTVVSL